MNALSFFMKNHAAKTKGKYESARNPEPTLGGLSMKRTHKPKDGSDKRKALVDALKARKAKS